MKHHYNKEYTWGSTHPGDWRYDLKAGGYHRAVRTFPEIRRNVSDKTEYRNEKIRYRDRSAGHMLDAWNDFPISRNYGRSWKDYTKYRKQWMRCREPEPVVPRWMRSYGRYWDLPWIGGYR